MVALSSCSISGVGKTNDVGTHRQVVFLQKLLSILVRRYLDTSSMTCTYPPSSKEWSLYTQEKQNAKCETLWSRCCKLKEIKWKRNQSLNTSTESTIQKPDLYISFGELTKSKTSIKHPNELVKTELIYKKCHPQQKRKLNSSIFITSFDPCPRSFYYFITSYNSINSIHVTVMFSAATVSVVKHLMLRNENKSIVFIHCYICYVKWKKIKDTYWHIAFSLPAPFFQHLYNLLLAFKCFALYRCLHFCLRGLWFMSWGLQIT